VRIASAVDNHSYLQLNGANSRWVLAMYVCICNAVTDRAIREAASRGVSTLDELTLRTGCASGCGSCADLAQEILVEARARKVREFPLALAIAA
jgi:bacterioferritin-associated ferredoxin